MPYGTARSDDGEQILTICRSRVNSSDCNRMRRAIRACSLAMIGGHRASREAAKESRAGPERPGQLSSRILLRSNVLAHFAQTHGSSVRACSRQVFARASALRCACSISLSSRFGSGRPPREGIAMLTGKQRRTLRRRHRRRSALSIRARIRPRRSIHELEEERRRASCSSVMPANVTFSGLRTAVALAVKKVASLQARHEKRAQLRRRIRLRACSIGLELSRHMR
jgi:hypothetical protein